ncbi:MAG: DUF6567 family protein [Bacteroidota bacterium]
MKNLLCLLFTATVLLTGCAVHSGTFSTNIPVDATGKPTYKIVEKAKGFAQATNILGIGGLDQESLIETARTNMELTYPLQPGQAYANVAVNTKREYYGVVTLTTIRITAQILDWDTARIQASRTKPKEQKILVGSYVSYSRKGITYTGRVDKISGNGKSALVIPSYAASGSLGSFVPLNELDTIPKPAKGPGNFRVDDEVIINYKGKEMKGIIKAMEPNMAKVQTTFDEGKKALLNVTYDKIRLENSRLPPKVEYKPIENPKEGQTVNFFEGGKLQSGTIQQVTSDKLRVTYLQGEKQMQMWIPRSQVFNVQ